MAALISSGSRFFDSLFGFHGGRGAVEEEHGDAADIDSMEEGLASDTKSGKGEAKFHIWETKVGSNEEGDPDSRTSSVGHASMELPNGDYVSVRPKHFGSVNPLTVLFPVKARNIEDVEKDIDIEGRAPDRTITVPLSEQEIEVMSAKREQLVEDMEAGKTKYQLLPEFGFLSTVKRTVAKAEEHEVFEGITSSKRVRKISSTDATHCSDAIADSLNEAGIDVPLSRAPWKITPSDLGNRLEELADRKPPSQGRVQASLR